MNLSGSKTSAATTACLFSLLISFYLLICCTDRLTGWSVLILHTSVLPILGFLLLAALVVLAVRATVVAWITVLVLLALFGKRRRVLVAQGRKIATEVALYSVEGVLKERGLAAVACATIISLIAMNWVG